MEKLDDKSWKPVPIMSIFTKFVNGKAKGRNHLINTEKNGVDYIGATNRNNGVMGHVIVNEETKKMVQPGNCIGFIRNGDGAAGYAIYRRTPFISTTDVIYGYSNWLNIDSGLFFVTSQDLIKSKYSHGYKRSPQRLKNDNVMLPVTDDGEPDYKYMEQYAEIIREKKLVQYRKYVQKRIDELGNYVNIPSLKQKKWQPIKLNSIMISHNSKAYHAENLDFNGGILPYVTRKGKDNGLYGFVVEENDMIVNPPNVISFGAETAEFFYQPYATITGNKMYYMINDKLNEYVGLFIELCLRHSIKDCFGYANGAIPERVMKKKIVLPITDNGNPDFEYMEQYSKNMMLRKYQQYLKFLDVKK